METPLGLVLILRGYLSAYDAETGKLDWRFYTVPGNPQDGFENAAMKKAAQTWGGKWWQLGGGGAVWDAIVFDPITDLVYFGVGNGTPWNARYRDPTNRDDLVPGLAARIGLGCRSAPRRAAVCASLRGLSW